MKHFLTVLALSLAFAGAVDAKPGGGGGGGGHSSFSSGSGSKGSFSSAPASRPSVAPSASPAGPPLNNKGSFNSANRPPAPAAGAPAQRTTTTTTTSVSRTSNYSYGGRYVSPGPMYGSWGMGYGYSNGLLTGMIIGNMMHPYGTVMYNGGGMYNGNAVLYPNGQVVDQSGHVVGTYIGGQFTPIQNGAYVAQPVPSDAGQQQVQPQPVIIEKTGPSALEIVCMILLGIGCVFLFFFILGVL